MPSNPVTAKIMPNNKPVGSAGLDKVGVGKWEGIEWGGGGGVGGGRGRGGGETSKESMLIREKKSS